MTEAFMFAAGMMVGALLGLGLAALMAMSGDEVQDPSELCPHSDSFDDCPDCRH